MESLLQISAPHRHEQTHEGPRQGGADGAALPLPVDLLAEREHVTPGSLFD